MPKGRGDARPLAAEELSLWRHVTRDAKPLKHRHPQPTTDPQPAAGNNARSERKAGTMARTSAVAIQPAAATLPELAAGAAPGVDSRTAGRLRRGELVIDGRLDLHGHTQEEAHRALVAFVETAWRGRARCVLVITGKGRSREGVGVLRAALPRWLNAEPLRQRILAFASAQAKHGGVGAVYVLLRRQR